MMNRESTPAAGPRR